MGSKSSSKSKVDLGKFLNLVCPLGWTNDEIWEEKKSWNKMCYWKKKSMTTSINET